MMPAVLVVADSREWAVIQTLRHTLPEGVSLMVQETLPTTPVDDFLLTITAAKEQTPPFIQVKNDSPKAWYRQFEKRRRK